MRAELFRFYRVFFGMDVYSEEQTCHVEYSLHGLLHDYDWLCRGPRWTMKCWIGFLSCNYFAWASVLSVKMNMNFGWSQDEIWWGGDEASAAVCVAWQGLMRIQQGTVRDAFSKVQMLQKAASQRWFAISICMHMFAWFLCVILGRQVEELKTPRQCFVIMSCAVATKKSVCFAKNELKGYLEERWTRPRGKGQIGHRRFGRKDPWWLWRLQQFRQGQT